MSNPGSKLMHQMTSSSTHPRKSKSNVKLRQYSTDPDITDNKVFSVLSEARRLLGIAYYHRLPLGQDLIPINDLITKFIKIKVSPIDICYGVLKSQALDDKPKKPGYAGTFDEIWKNHLKKVAQERFPNETKQDEKDQAFDPSDEMRRHSITSVSTTSLSTDSSSTLHTESSSTLPTESPALSAAMSGTTTPIPATFQNRPEAFSQALSAHHPSFVSSTPASQQPFWVVSSDVYKVLAVAQQFFSPPVRFVYNQQIEQWISDTIASFCQDEEEHGVIDVCEELFRKIMINPVKPARQQEAEFAKHWDIFKPQVASFLSELEKQEAEQRRLLFAQQRLEKVLGVVDKVLLKNDSGHSLLDIDRKSITDLATASIVNRDSFDAAAEDDQKTSLADVCKDVLFGIFYQYGPKNLFKNFTQEDSFSKLWEKDLGPRVEKVVAEITGTKGEMKEGPTPSGATAGATSTPSTAIRPINDPAIVAMSDPKSNMR